MVAEYVEFHRNGVASLANADNIEGVPSSSVPVLVWSCLPHFQCGGHGERFNEILIAFLLAIFTRRVFLIDSESPLPLHMVLSPSKLDWRVRSFALSELRHLSYHDKRIQFEADISRLIHFHDPILVVNINRRRNCAVSVHSSVSWIKSSLLSTFGQATLPMRSGQFSEMRSAGRE